MVTNAFTPARHRGGTLRALATAALLMLALPILSGCGAGTDAQTQQPYQPAEGVTVRSSEVYVVNALVVADDEGNGTVVSALINQADEPDSLVPSTAETGEGDEVQVAPMPTEGIELAPHTAEQTAHSGALRVTGETVTPGGLVTLTFEFEQAAPCHRRGPGGLVGRPRLLRT